MVLDHDDPSAVRRLSIPGGAESASASAPSWALGLTSGRARNLDRSRRLEAIGGSVVAPRFAVQAEADRSVIENGDAIERQPVGRGCRLRLAGDGGSELGMVQGGPAGPGT